MSHIICAQDSSRLRHQGLIPQFISLSCRFFHISRAVGSLLVCILNHELSILISCSYT